MQNYSSVKQKIQEKAIVCFAANGDQIEMLDPKDFSKLLDETTKEVWSLFAEIENLRRHNHYHAETDKWLIPQRQLFALEKQAIKILAFLEGNGKEKKTA